MTEKRKIIQIAATPIGSYKTNNQVVFSHAHFVALCNDGTMWTNEIESNEWIEMPNIPQHKARSDN